MIYNVKFALLKRSAKIQFFVNDNTRGNPTHEPSIEDGIYTPCSAKTRAIANAVNQR